MKHVIGAFIIYLAFSVFATAVYRMFRLAAGFKGTLARDALFGFGLVTLIASVVAAASYGDSLLRD